MGTRNIIFVVIALVVGMLMTPLIMDAVEDVKYHYDEAETHVAVEILATAEVITLAESPETDSTTVWVNAVQLAGTSFTVAANTLTVHATFSETGDIIQVEYDYERDLPTGVSTILPMIPVFYVLFLLGIAAMGIKRLF